MEHVIGLNMVAKSGEIQRKNYVATKNSDEKAHECEKAVPLIDELKNKEPLETILAIIKAGEDVNCTDGHGMTPLIWAIDHEDSEVLHAIINAGAEVNCSDCDG